MLKGYRCKPGMQLFNTGLFENTLTVPLMFKNDANQNVGNTVKILV